MQFMNVKAIKQEVCAEQYKKLITKIYNGSLCSMSPHGQGSCYGDNGNPLVSNGQLIGVYSWQRKWGVEPQVYTRISAFLEWVEKVSGVVAV